MQFPAEQVTNLQRLTPEIALCFFGVLIMVIDPFVSAARKRTLAWLGFIGALVALGGVRVAAWNPGPAYSDLMRVDAFSIFVHVIVIGAAALAILGSMQYLEDEGIQRGEYYALVLFATAGMGILAGANELVTAFVGLEMSSISSYILAGFRKRAIQSNEASLKYFILGSFATAFFLYGIAMTYGATGTTRIDLVQAILQGLAHPPALAILGLGLIFVGLGFKVVAAPFQIYAPDVYEGAPTPVTALLASAPKAATFALMLRIFYVSFGSASSIWFWAIWISAVLTMSIGNLAALVQTNVKRTLAYSSIAHAGYILVAFAASTVVGVAAVLFYLATYALMKVGAFLVLAHLGQTGEKRLEIQDYAGLGQKQPVLAACFSLFLLSLLGLPATGGFLGKFFAFQAALDSRIVWLVVIAAINSVVGAYYYLRVIVAMYFWEPSKEYGPTKVAPALSVALFVAAIG
ncbi:MAG TPA: NADH-quinone oxidoreductase subunit N, partial [Candidatus Limnocylindria bacterium]|nr:NADH-quinone oxidoreductase subunit N [Candidatus Limnocylindria bacterium]